MVREIHNSTGIAAEWGGTVWGRCLMLDAYHADGMTKRPAVCDGALSCVALPSSLCGVFAVTCTDRLRSLNLLAFPIPPACRNTAIRRRFDAPACCQICGARFAFEFCYFFIHVIFFCFYFFIRFPAVQFNIL